MRTTFLFLALCLAILPGCALLRGQNETTIIDINDNLDEALAETSPSVPKSLRWTNPVSLEVYMRLAEAIVFEKAPDFSGFSEEQIAEAYNAIFVDPTKRWSNINYGWYAMFQDLVEEFSSGRVVLYYGWGDEPVFARYKGKQWETPFLLIKVRRTRDGKRVESGLVITPSEPKPEPTEQAE